MRILAKMCIVMMAFALFLVGETRAEEVTSTNISYTVKRGDRLATIAHQFGTNDYLAIAAMNKISNPDLIYPGQLLTLPFATKAKTEAAAPTMVTCATSDVHTEIGIASWYGTHFHGKTTANNESFDMNAHTVAHPSLPFGTIVCVRNSKNGRSVVARVNDRGPEQNGRIINVSQRIAQLLDFSHSGTAQVAIFAIQRPTTVGLRSRTLETPQRPRNMSVTQARTVTNNRMMTRSVIMPPETTPGHVGHDKATDLPMFFMSEVVVTEFGPAHVIDGLNTNTISPRDAIAKLFTEQPMHVRDALLAAVENDQYVETTLEVGDRLPLMLAAEGVVFHDILQAQMSNTALAAHCYIIKDEASERDYRLIREQRGGNWYAEIFSPRDQEHTSCTRKKRPEGR